MSCLRSTHTAVCHTEGCGWQPGRGVAGPVRLSVLAFGVGVVGWWAGSVVSLKETDTSSVFAFEAEAGLGGRHTRSSEAQMCGSGNGNAHSGAHWAAHQ